MNIQKIIEQSEALFSQNKPLIALRKIQKIDKKGKQFPEIFLFGAKYARFCGKQKLAESYHKKSIQYSNRDYRCYLDYGGFLQKERRYVAAERYLEESIKLNPGSEACLNLIALNKYLLNKPKDAIIFSQKALEINNTNKVSMLTHGLISLRLGDFINGWQFFENRRNVFENRFGNFFPESLSWSGENLNNKVLVILPEEGHGDFISYFRFVDKISEKYKNSLIKLIVDPALYPLIREINKNSAIEIINSQNEEAINFLDFDFWTPIMSIPKNLLLNSPETLFPYIYLDSKNFKPTMLSNNEPNIGLCWRGNPKNTNDIDRSVHSPKDLIYLVKDLSVNFISLQYDATEEELRLSKTFMNFPKNPITSFHDTANIVSNLDMVITIDSAVSHLSGAMNIPTLIIYPNQDIHYMCPISNKKSFWYESTEIFMKDDSGWVKTMKKIRRVIELKFSLSCKN